MPTWKFVLEISVNKNGTNFSFTEFQKSYNKNTPVVSAIGLQKIQC